MSIETDVFTGVDLSNILLEANQNMREQMVEKLIDVYQLSGARTRATLPKTSTIMDVLESLNFDDIIRDFAESKTRKRC